MSIINQTFKETKTHPKPEDPEDPVLKPYVPGVVDTLKEETRNYR